MAPSPSSPATAAARRRLVLVQGAAAAAAAAGRGLEQGFCGGERREELIRWRRQCGARVSRWEEI